MKTFLEKYNASRIETYQDEGKLTLERCKKRILGIVAENIKNFKDDSWTMQNRMNKLIKDTAEHSIFALRIGGKTVLRYSLDILDRSEKMNFLADVYNSIEGNEYDEELIDFLAKEVEKSKERKKEAQERNKLKHQEARAKKRLAQIEARKRTLEAGRELLPEDIVANIPLYEQL